MEFTPNAAANGLPATTFNFTQFIPSASCGNPQPMKEITFPI